MPFDPATTCQSLSTGLFKTDLPFTKVTDFSVKYFARSLVLKWFKAAFLGMDGAIVKNVIHV